MNNRRKSMIRINEFKLKDVFAAMNRGKKTKLGKHRVKVGSCRLRLFKKNHKCVNCGLEANTFILEKCHTSDVTPHLNMYRKCRNGRLILFTKDHIIPKSKGGKTHMSNLQTMCCYCNVCKGDKVEKPNKEV